MRHISWLVIIMLLVSSCGVSELKKRYPPEVVKGIERILIFRTDVLSQAQGHYTELGFIEVHDLLLYSWERIEFMAKAQAYQRYSADIIVRATYDVGGQNPLTGSYDDDKYIRGVAVKFINQEARDMFFKWYNEWQKEGEK